MCVAITMKRIHKQQFGKKKNTFTVEWIVVVKKEKFS